MSLLGNGAEKTGLCLNIGRVQAYGTVDLVRKDDSRRAVPWKIQGRDGKTCFLSSVSQQNMHYNPRFCFAKTVSFLTRNRHENRPELTDRIYLSPNKYLSKKKCIS